MGGPPKPEDNEPNPSDNTHSTSDPTPLAQQNSEPKQPSKSASNPPERTQQISRTFNTAIRQTLLKIQNVIVFMDHHNGVITALATIAIAILTGFYVGYAKNQWIVMHAQLQEIRSSSLQTEKMIAIATAQSETSKVSTETAQQTLMANQRAWLGPNDAKLAEAPVAGKKLDVVITYHNTGKEPARNVAWAVERIVTTPEEETNETLGEKITAFLAKCLLLKEREAGQVIYPSIGFGHATLRTIYPAEIIDEDIVNGKKWLVIQGCFVYRTFDKVRHSGFCFFYRGDMTKPEHLNVCLDGNYAD